jgi:hypothetical protein
MCGESRVQTNTPDNPPTWCGAQSSLHLAKLHAHTVDLDLVVDAAQAINFAVCLEAAQIPCKFCSLSADVYKSGAKIDSKSNK